MFEPGRVSLYWFSGMNGILAFFYTAGEFFRTFFLAEKSAPEWIDNKYEYKFQNLSIILIPLLLLSRAPH